MPESGVDAAVPGVRVAIVKDERSLARRRAQPGVSHRVFSALAEKNFVVDMIAQGVGSGERPRLASRFQSELATLAD